LVILERACVESKKEKRKKESKKRVRKNPTILSDRRVSSYRNPLAGISLLALRALVALLCLGRRVLRPILGAPTVRLNGVSLRVVKRISVVILRDFAVNVTDRDPRLSTHVETLGGSLDIVIENFHKPRTLGVLFLARLSRKIARFDPTLPQGEREGIGTDRLQPRVFEKIRVDFRRDGIEIRADLGVDVGGKLPRTIRHCVDIQFPILRHESHEDSLDAANRNDVFAHFSFSLF